MSFDSYKIYFFCIHLLNLIALVTHIGIKEDGFDVKTKRLSKQGKLASVMEFFALLMFGAFIYLHDHQSNLSSLYLGFGITVSIFAIPFLSTCHIKYSKSKVRLNFAGFVALLVGLSGFLTSVIWFFDRAGSTDMIDNYISILGQFIAGTSALIAFSGTTIESKDIKNDKGKPIPVTRLTDLGKVAITVIIIGFAVSIINFNLENAEQKRVNIEVDQILKQAQEIATNLDSANHFLTHDLMPKTEHWLVDLNDKVMEIRRLEEKVVKLSGKVDSLASRADIGALNTQLSKINRELNQLSRGQKQVAKQTSVQQLEQKLKKQEKQLAQLKQQITKLNQSKAIASIKNEIQILHQEINTMKKEVKSTAKTSDIESLKKKLSQLETLMKIQSSNN